MINCVLCALNCENKQEDVRKIYHSEIKEVDLSSGYERKGRFFFLLEALDLGSFFDWLVVCTANLPFLCSFFTFLWGYGCLGNLPATLSEKQMRPCTSEHLEILCYTHGRYYYFKKQFLSFWYV